MTNLERTSTASTQPEGNGALVGPSRPDMRVQTLDQFKTAVTESSEQLASAFAILKQVNDEGLANKSDAFQQAQRLLAAAIEALDPIAKVIEGQAAQLPANASWLQEATEGLEALQKDIKLTSQTLNPKEQSTQIQQILFKFPPLTGSIESQLPPLQRALKELRRE